MTGFLSSKSRITEIRYFFSMEVYVMQSNPPPLADRILPFAHFAHFDFDDLPIGAINGEGINYRKFSLNRPFLMDHKTCFFLKKN